MRFWMLLAPMLLTACGGKADDSDTGEETETVEETDTEDTEFDTDGCRRNCDTETDTDTDTDTDPDTDPDTDSDSDTDSGMDTDTGDTGDTSDTGDTDTDDTDDSDTDDTDTNDSDTDDSDSDTDDALTCLVGPGTTLSPTGSGTCADPYVVDLSAYAAGEQVTVVVDGATGADESDPGWMPCIDAAARDVVFSVTLPAGGTDLTLSVDAATGSDPILAVHEDPQCGQPVNGCGNVGGADDCDIVHASKGAEFWGDTTFVRVSEMTASGVSWTVRFLGE